MHHIQLSVRGGYASIVLHRAWPESLCLFVLYKTSCCCNEPLSAVITSSIYGTEYDRDATLVVPVRPVRGHDGPDSIDHRREFCRSGMIELPRFCPLSTCREGGTPLVASSRPVCTCCSRTFPADTDTKTRHACSRNQSTVRPCDLATVDR